MSYKFPYLLELKLKPGDRVRYARAFCQTLGVPPTDPIWRATGILESIGQPFAEVKWDGRPADEPGRYVKLCAIAKIGSADDAWGDHPDWIGHETLGEKPRSKFN